MKNELRPLWRKLIHFNWRFGVILLLLVCLPRFILVLQVNVTGNYSMIALIMLASALMPFIFLSKQGRETIGLRKTRKFRRLLLALSIGLAGSFVLYLLGQGLYGDSYQNWYKYIGLSYMIPENISPDDKRLMFILMAITGMTFSPIGEELFFRGIVHESFARSLGERYASIIDSAAFALTHLAHFGLVYLNGQWQLFPLPAFLWVLSMFLTSLLFIQLKQYTHSLWGAVLCHAGFNLGMIYCIFYLL